MGLLLSRLQLGTLAVVSLVLVQGPQQLPGGSLNVILGPFPIYFSRGLPVVSVSILPSGEAHCTAEGLSTGASKKAVLGRPPRTAAR
jgi:hypothetical protein